MAFNIKASLDAILSHLAASGRLSSYSLGEPVKVPEGAKLHGAVYMRRSGVDHLYLDGGTGEVHAVVVRLYRAVLRQPQSEGELELVNAVSELTEDFAEDYTLGTTVREIDLAAQFGEGISAEWGHVEVSGSMFRVVDITLPLVVDDSATAAA